MSNISATVGLVYLFWIALSILAAYGLAMFGLGVLAKKHGWVKW
jgi:hypothetical protein